MREILLRAEALREEHGGNPFVDPALELDVGWAPRLDAPRPSVNMRRFRKEIEDAEIVRGHAPESMGRLAGGRDRLRRRRIDDGRHDPVDLLPERQARARINERPVLELLFRKARLDDRKTHSPEEERGVPSPVALVLPDGGHHHRESAPEAQRVIDDVRDDPARGRGEDPRIGRTHIDVEIHEREIQAESLPRLAENLPPRETEVANDRIGRVFFHRDFRQTGKPG